MREALTKAACKPLSRRAFKTHLEARYLDE